MKTFYLYENGSPVGPFSIDQLRSKQITSETLIWKEGMPEWLAASELSELSSLFIKTPPPIHNSFSEAPTAFMTATERTGFNIGKALGWTGVLAVAIIIFLIVNASQSSGTFRPKTPEEIRAELLYSEQQNPTKYITGKYQNWENLIGQRVIELRFKNNATLAIFKDVVVRVTYFSKTHTNLGDQEFTWFEYFRPGQTQTHKIRTIAPGGTKDVEVSVISAASL